MNKILLYHIPKKIWAASIDEVAPNWNLPMYQNTIIIYKNSSQTIEIDVVNIDRKAVLIFDSKIYVNILNRQELLLTKRCKIPRTSKNKAILELSPTDTMHWQEGYYSYSVYMENDKGEKTLLVLDQAMSSVGTFELRGGAFPNVKDTVYFERFNALSIGSVVDPTPVTRMYFDSEVYRQTKNDKILYTAAVYCKDFSGHLWMKASIADNPPGTDFEWFDMKIENKDHIKFIEFTGIHVFNVEANIKYLKFRYLPDFDSYTVDGLLTSGKIERILLRD